MTPPSDGAALLDRIRAFVDRFVAFPMPEALTAVVLWVAHAHIAGFFYTSPRLALLSPEPGSGKTRVLEVLYTLVMRPMFSFSASPAAIFRKLAQEDHTLLFDEVDTIFSKRGKDEGNEDLRALLNAGYRRGATIPRCVGPRHDVQEFGVFAPVALAGLGDLPDTVMSRSIIVRMRRRAPSERVEQFRMRIHEAEGFVLRDELAVWAADVGGAVGEAFPDLPPGVVDRDAEVWEPLIAVADAAGGHWPATARAACVALLKVANEREVSLGVRLLGDLRTVFGEHDTMTTADVIERLNGLDEAPWGDLYGKGLDARILARMLKRYGVTSTKVKVHEKALQGYRREHLWDTFQRYLSPVPAEVEPTEPSSTADRSGVGDGASSVPHTGVHSIQVPFAPEPASAAVPQVPEPRRATEPRTRVLDGTSPQVPEVPLLREEGRTLEDRAAAKAAQLLTVAPADVKVDLDQKLTATKAPGFWRTTAATEPVAVLTALHLIVEDLSRDDLAPPARYLAAARAAVGHPATVTA